MPARSTPSCACSRTSRGRFVGKRILPHFFLEDVMGEEGLHACLYLIAIDMEMEPLPGFEYASWETGYGDFKMIPDMSTLRLVPWLEKTAMVICDVADEHTGELVEVAPRTILKRQVERAKQAGYTFKTGSELEFYLFKESYDEAAQKRYQDLQPELAVHHGLPHAPDHQGRVADPPDPQQHVRRGDPDRVLEGRVRQGPARDQHHLRRRARDGRLPRDLQARREGDRRVERRRDHVHGEMDDGRGRFVVPHARERLERGRERVADVERRRPEPHVRDVWSLPRRVDVDGTGDGVDVRAVRELVQAVPARILGADGDPVEPRQPDVWIPGGRRAQRVSRGVPHPRRRREPVPGLRRNDRERTPRDREQGRVPAAVRGERLRVEGRGSRPLVAPRGDRRRWRPPR